MRRREPDRVDVDSRFARIRCLGWFWVTPDVIVYCLELVCRALKRNSERLVERV